MADTPKRATYADVEAAPENLVAEIIFGELKTHPRRSTRHVTTAIALALELGGPFQEGIGGPGGWVFADEPELHLGDNVLVPDLGAWRRERLREHPDTSYFTLTPDWVCEVLSAYTEARDRTVKMGIYAAAGIPHLWLIDPRQQMLEALENRGGQWTVISPRGYENVVRVAPFDAISFSLADLWPLDPPLGLNENPQALNIGDR